MPYRLIFSTAEVGWSESWYDLRAQVQLSGGFHNIQQLRSSSLGEVLDASTIPIRCRNGSLKRSPQHICDSIQRAFDTSNCRTNVHECYDLSSATSWTMIHVDPSISDNINFCRCSLLPPDASRQIQSHHPPGDTLTCAPLSNFSENFYRRRLELALWRQPFCSLEEQP